MAIKYPEDRARFISDLRAAGLPAGRASSLELAELLGFSVSHIKNLFYGANQYGSTTKDKLDALIAAKANGPEPVEQFEVDLQHGPILTPTNEQSSWSEPADLPPASDYAVIDATDGTAVLVEILARFNNHTVARKICQKLNKDGG